MSALDFPSSPVNGQTFVDGPRTWTFNSFYGVWNITSEGIIGQTGFTGSIGFTGSKGSTTVSPSAPTSPINGDLWWNSETGVRYVFYTDGTSNQWVQDSAGVKGSTGFVGSQGITGFTGSFGITGFTGSFGPVAGSNTQLVYNNSGIAAGANVFFDNTNGNVGIGLSPTAKLHVAGTIQSSSGSTTAQMFADGGAAYFTSVGSYPSIFSTNSAERMRITSDGYLLVGGTTTGLGAAGRGLVDINGSGSAALGLSAGGTLAGYIFHDGTTGMSVWQERNGFMAFGTNAAEKMRLTAAGNLGIGTTAPGSILDVRTAAGSGTFLTLVNTSATLNTNVIETSYTLSNAQTGSSTVAVIGATNPFAVGNTYGDIYFKTTNPTSGLVERMRIDSAGNVGIGTTAPLAKLDVNGQGLFQGSTSSTYRGANIGALNINNNTVDGTVDFTQGLVFTDNTNNSGAWAHAGIVATGSEGFRGSLVFGTVNTGEKSNTVIERMRITPGGNLGIGTSGPNAPLDVTATLSGFSASGGSIQRLTNPSSTGQSPLDFFINGTLRGRFRSDYAGNMNYVTNGGAHYFFIGGDSGVGTVPVSISSAGVLQVNGLLDLSGGTG